MLNINQIGKYNDLRLSDSQTSADTYAQTIISEMNLKTPLERGHIWDEFKQQMNQENIDSKKDAAKAKRQAKKGKISIKKVCVKLLEMNLSSSERGFISDISNKRKLTVKQEGWFLDIAKSKNVETGTVERKKSKSIVNNCQHEDLGSLGYTHGTTVKCPHCGNMAEVW